MLKKAIIVLLALVAGYAIAQNHQRMQYQGTERISKSDGDTLYFDFVHDSETGQEIVCVAGSGIRGPISCYLTGRHW